MYLQYSLFWKTWDRLYWRIKKYDKIQILWSFLTYYLYHLCSLQVQNALWPNSKKWALEIRMNMTLAILPYVNWWIKKHFFERKFEVKLQQKHIGENLGYWVIVEKMPMWKTHEFLPVRIGKSLNYSIIIS